MGRNKICNFVGHALSQIIRIAGKKRLRHTSIADRNEYKKK